MQIIVNNKPAVVKKDTKIDFISENRRFTGADAYTLNITFPLKDCPQNQDIFGHLERMDVEKNAVRLHTEIFAGRFHRVGVLTPTEVNEVSVKCQFLEGRSVQNYATDLDEVFINELNLGRPRQTVYYGDYYMGTGQEFFASVDEVNYVALPWVNNYSGNLQNGAVGSLGSPASENTSVKVSFQPYLVYIAEMVCHDIGFDYDFTEWRNSKYKHLLVCNTLPAAWDLPEFKYAMPDWSVTQFFEELEKLMDCEIDVDFVARKVTMTFSQNYFRKFPEVRIDNVLNEYTATVSDENETEYREAVNIGYAEADHPLQCYYSCQWYLDTHRPVKTYDDLYWLIYEETDDLRTPSLCKGLMYARAENRYYVWRRVQSGTNSTAVEYILQEVNQFGPVLNDPTTDEIKKELNIVPVEIEHINYETYVMFLDPGELEDTSTTNRYQYQGAADIEAGQREKSAAHYSKMFVAFWDGNNRIPYNKRLCPYTDSVMFLTTAYTNRYYATPPYSLKLTQQTRIYPIHPKTKYTISFLADEMPDPRSIFYIRGRKFVCAKLTASITEEGMSEKIKGEFYLMKE